MVLIGSAIHNLFLPRHNSPAWFVIELAAVSMVLSYILLEIIRITKHD
jgi:hypothetical protein